jgi:YHS domain-containing protein
MFKSLKLGLIFALIASTFSSGLFASGSHKQAEHKKKEEKTFHVKGTQKVCPIRKEKVDSDSFVDYKGQRIYFCCSGCDKKFLKDTEKYFKEMKVRGEVAESIQTICPVSGDELEDHDSSVTLAGRKIYFCCKRCVKSFKKDKEKYLLKMGHKKPNAHKAKAHDHSSHEH